MNKLFDNLLSPPQHKFIPEVARINKAAKALQQQTKVPPTPNLTVTAPIHSTVIKTAESSPGTLLTKLGINATTPNTAPTSVDQTLITTEMKRIV